MKVETINNTCHQQIEESVHTEILRRIAAA